MDTDIPSSVSKKAGIVFYDDSPPAAPAPAAPLAPVTATPESLDVALVRMRRLEVTIESKDAELRAMERSLTEAFSDRDRSRVELEDEVTDLRANLRRTKAELDHARGEIAAATKALSEAERDRDAALREYKTVRDELQRERTAWGRK